MYAFRLWGMFAIIPTAILLTISFFVLFTIRKVETQGLRGFGYVVAALLWMAAVIVFSVGIYTVSSGNSIMMPMMHQMMGCGSEKNMMSDYMSGAMMRSQMPGQNMQEKTQSQMMKH